MALIRLLVGSRSSNVPSVAPPSPPPVVLDEIVAGSIASLNVAVTVVPGFTPVDPVAGNTDVTVGGVESGGATVLNTTSTQYASEK